MSQAKPLKIKYVLAFMFTITEICFAIHLAGFNKNGRRLIVSTIP